MEWFEVRITIDDDVFEDAIMGTSRHDALINALDNWEDAERIEVI